MKFYLYFFNAYFNIHNKIGQSALHVACFENHRDSHYNVIILLVHNYTFDLNRKDLYQKILIDLLLMEYSHSLTWYVRMCGYRYIYMYYLYSKEGNNVGFVQNTGTLQQKK